MTLNGQAIEKLPKTDYSIREVDMPAWYMNELRDYRDQWLQEKQLQGDSWLGGDKEYVFHSGNGKPYYYSRPSHNWKVFIRRHQLKEIRLHDLRHSAATLLIEENASLKAIQGGSVIPSLR